MKNSKKIMLFCLVAVLSVSLLAGCAPKPANDPPPSQSAPADTSTPAAPTGSTSPGDYWSPADGAPASYNAGSEVYTMQNRVPWQGIYAPVESSRISVDKAIKADNKKDSVTVGYATWTVGTPFFAGMHDTIKAECEKYGWTFIPAVADADINKQVANIENFITMGVDVIIDVAFSGEAEAIAIKAAVDEGIPCIGLGLPFPDGTPIVTNCATMYYEQGFMVGMYAAEQFAGKAVKAATSPGQIGHPIAESKLNGFLGGFSYMRAIQAGTPFASREEAMLYGYELEQQIVKSAKFTDTTYNWEVVTSIDGFWSRDDGQKAAEDILTAHPDVDLIFMDNDEESQGAIMAIEQAGLVPGKDVMVACVGDASKNALELIRDGKLMCLTLASPYTWSKATTDLAHMIFVEGFDATNLPSNVHLGNVLVHKDNVTPYIPATDEYATLPDQEFIPLG